MTWSFIVEKLYITTLEAYFQNPIVVISEGSIFVKPAGRAAFTFPPHR